VAPFAHAGPSQGAELTHRLLQSMLGCDTQQGHMETASLTVDGNGGAEIME
jgi:hypothetical protein